MATAPNNEAAIEYVAQAVYAPSFFSKSASNGLTPSTPEERQQLLELAVALRSRGYQPKTAAAKPSGNAFLNHLLEKEASLAVRTPAYRQQVCLNALANDEHLKAAAFVLSADNEAS